MDPCLAILYSLRPEASGATFLMIFIDPLQKVLGVSFAHGDFLLPAHIASDDQRPNPFRNRRSMTKREMVCKSCSMRRLRQMVRRSMRRVKTRMSEFLLEGCQGLVIKID